MPDASRLIKPRPDARTPRAIKAQLAGAIALRHNHQPVHPHRFKAKAVTGDNVSAAAYAVLATLAIKAYRLAGKIMLDLEGSIETPALAT